MEKDIHKYNITPHNVLINSNGILTDVYSKLFDDRIVFLTDAITEETANVLKAQLLYLNHLDNSTPIKMYIDSPGGHVYTALGIVDIMEYIDAPVETVNIGLAASMAAIILSCGEKGSRRSLKRSRVMLHQPSGGIYGQSSDMEIAAKEIKEVKNELTSILVKNTIQSKDKIVEDLDRDFWMSASQSRKYGIIDKII